MREHAIVRGKHAADVMDNPAYQEAIADVQQDLFARFAATGADQSVEREKVWAVFQAVSEVHQMLKQYVHTGKLEGENKRLEAHTKE